MKKLKKLSFYLLCAFAGLLIPVFFAVSDLLELELNFTLNNFTRIVQSQNIYLFSSVFFPILGMALNYLMRRIQLQNKKIKFEFQHFKALLDACPDPILFLDKNKEILFQNEQFSKHFNCVEDISERFELDKRLNNKTFYQGEVTTTTEDLETHPFLFTYKTITLDGEIHHFLSFANLSDLKEQENIIENQRHQVIEKTRLAALGEMAAGIAHEVNNPLTIIHSNNCLIQKALKGDNCKKEMFIKLMDKNTQQVHRITNIINALRNLSRGMANEESEVFSIDSVFKEVSELAVLRDIGRKIEFRHNESDFKVYANRGHIVQIILNLVNNAMDEIENSQDPWIEFSSTQQNKYIDIYVKDCGPGISQSIVNKIFTPMFTTKEVGKGTGLGLSLSRTYAEQNNGSLSYVYNASNTSFKLTLPSEEKIKEDLSVA